MHARTSACAMLETISERSPGRGIPRRADWLAHRNAGSTLLNHHQRINSHPRAHPHCERSLIVLTADAGGPGLRASSFSLRRHVCHLPQTAFPSHAPRNTMTLVQVLVQAAEDRPVLAFAVVSVLLLLVAKAASSNQEYPSLPWVGKDDSKSFAGTRATLSSISNVKNWLAEGYQKVG